MSIASFSFKGTLPGPHLLVFGGVHGDETCGPEAIRSVLEEIEAGRLPLSSGTVTLVPEANPEACARGVRQTEENLNRIFRKTESPSSYEARIANELCPLADAADVLLDIHSSAAPAPTNAFLDYPSEKTRSLVDALGVEFQITGWPEVYAGNDAGFPSYTVERYMDDHGKYGVTLECGQHTDPNAAAVAKDGILRSLSHLGLIGTRFEQKKVTPVRVHMRALYGRETEEDVFLGDWAHLQTVPDGTEIARRGTGEVLRADGETVLIFPKSYAKPGEEWFYTAVRTEAR